eukprot:scaffold38421_cov63-Attheya_sp.AAC.1
MVEDQMNVADLPSPNILFDENGEDENGDKDPVSEGVAIISGVQDYDDHAPELDFNDVVDRIELSYDDVIASEKSNSSRVDFHGKTL